MASLLLYFLVFLGQAIPSGVPLHGEKSSWGLQEQLRRTHLPVRGAEASCKLFSWKAHALGLGLWRGRVAQAVVQLRLLF